MQGKQNYEGQLVDNLKSEKDKRRKTVISFGNGFQYFPQLHYLPTLWYFYHLFQFFSRQGWIRFKKRKRKRGD